MSLCATYVFVTLFHCLLVSRDKLITPPYHNELVQHCTITFDLRYILLNIALCQKMQPNTTIFFIHTCICFLQVAVLNMTS